MDCTVDGLLGRCPLPEIECIWDSDVLVKLRNDSGYTVNYVASAVGMRPQEYELLERGRLNPPADVLIRLSELFTCEVDYLLGRSFEHIDQEHGTKKRPILSSEAQKIAMDYDTLDDYGKNAVRSLTTAELDRVREAFSPTAGSEQVG